MHSNGLKKELKTGLLTEAGQAKGHAAPSYSQAWLCPALHPSPEHSGVGEVVVDQK